MALSGVEIFKLLPKTNCKKCGHPTCLAFAMKLAQRQASIDACPDMSEDAKAKLSDASAPPIRAITIGTGDKAVKVGEETVLFRHEKKFVNPTCLAFEISDTISKEQAKDMALEVVSSEIDRVGQKLRIDAIAIKNDSADAAKFAAIVDIINQSAPSLPVILMTENPASAESALKILSDKKPLLYGATEANLDAMANLAKNYKTSLGVKARGLEALSALTEKAVAIGVHDLVIDPSAESAKDILETNTLIRRAAIKKGFKPLGFPVINFTRRQNPYLETLIATLGIAKYAGIVVINSIDKWKNLALFTFRQNIYTDPQVPMQVQQKIYEIGDVKPETPLLITTNFSLTYFIVSGEVENSKVPTRLAVMDCEGLSVLTAWAAGKFTASKIANFIKESGVEEIMANKELVIPGYVAILSGAIEEKLPGWKIVVGPREANALPAFLRAKVA